MVFTDAEIRKNGLKCPENERGHPYQGALPAPIAVSRLFPCGLPGTGKYRHDVRDRAMGNHTGFSRCHGGSLVPEKPCSEPG